MVPPYPQIDRKPVRGWRLPVLVLLLTLAALVPVAAPAAPGQGLVAPPPATNLDPPRVPALWMPVTGAVVRGFDARAGPYGPGHRGIDIAAPVGATVRSPAAGKVVFAGPVADLLGQPPGRSRRPGDLGSRARPGQGRSGLLQGAPGQGRPGS